LRGGTVTWAEPPSPGPALYDIFPFVSLQHYSVASSAQFQDLMYRPLYWFGSGNTPDLNTALSLADPPAYDAGAKTVTVTLKSWKWSDGEPLTAANVLLWMNILKADVTKWAFWAPGSGSFPQDVTDVTTNGPHTIVFHLNRNYDSTWFTDNELSQITPLPTRWDVTSPTASPGSGGCSAAPYSAITTKLSSSFQLTDVSADAKKCAEVLGFLSGRHMAADPSGYATNRLWKVVDGPFVLSAYDAATGRIVLSANRAYSGFPRPTIGRLVEVPFSSASREYAALRAGRIDIGYAPIGDVPRYSGPAFVNGAPAAGNNPPGLAGYSLAPLYQWGINYLALNYTNATDGSAAVLKQLYVRQAMQSLVDEPALVAADENGYATPTYGPVPAVPPNTFASSSAGTDPYPYDPSKARSLLSAHGWHVAANGVSTCVHAGTSSSDCGPGVRAGAGLSFTVLFATGSPSLASELKAERASFEQAGIKLDLVGKPFADVVSQALPCTTRSKCSWDMADWGGGWNYAPDYDPTGEDTFETGAGSNVGGYSDPATDTAVQLTLTTSGSSAMSSYETAVAQQVPVIWEPEPAYSLTEIKAGICGVLPEEPTLNLTPEYWYRCTT
jgi:peptide/nickel transport system substrate-binding protein